MSVKINVEYTANDWITISQFLSSRMNLENDWSDFVKVMTKYLQTAFNEGRMFERQHPDLEE